MQRLRSWIRGDIRGIRKLTSDRGMGEAATAIVVLPFMIALVFVLLETGFNLRYRGMVDNVVQDTVRGISQDGADYWAATDTVPAGFPNWTAYGQSRLNDLCNGNTRCTQPPALTCWPAGPYAEPGGASGCTAVFYYKPIAGFTTNNPVFNLGFGRLWADPIETTIQSRTVVGTG